VRRIAPVLTVAVACLAIHPCSEVNAQGRGPSATELRARFPPAEDTPETRASKRAELANWLSRLEGRFRVTGLITNTSEDLCEKSKRRFSGINCRNEPPPPSMYIRGLADCAVIGTGPGVHCMFSASWDDPPPPPTQQILRDPWLLPGVMLF
jgi:hypothetical protein